MNMTVFSSVAHFLAVGIVLSVGVSGCDLDGRGDPLSMIRVDPDDPDDAVAFYNAVVTARPEVHRWDLECVNENDGVREGCEIEAIDVEDSARVLCTGAVVGPFSVAVPPECVAERSTMTQNSAYITETTYVPNQVLVASRLTLI